jgi:hypothetical protein
MPPVPTPKKDPFDITDTFCAQYSKSYEELRFAEFVNNTHLIKHTHDVLTKLQDDFTAQNLWPAHATQNIINEIREKSLDTFRNIKDGNPVAFASGLIAAQNYTRPTIT